MVGIYMCIPKDMDKVSSLQPAYLSAPAHGISRGLFQQAMRLMQGLARGTKIHKGRWQKSGGFHADWNADMLAYSR